MTVPPPANPPATHGKDGLIYMSTSATGTLSVVALLSKYTIDMTTATVETTAFTDKNKTFVQGLPDLKGTFSGFWNKDDDTLFDAAASPDGIQMMIIPSVLDKTKNFGGPAWVNASIAGDVNGAVTVTGSFVANGSWTRDGTPPAA